MYIIIKTYTSKVSYYLGDGKFSSNRRTYTSKDTVGPKIFHDLFDAEQSLEGLRQITGDLEVKRLTLENV